jgi:hypothetical protein
LPDLRRLRQIIPGGGDRAENPFASGSILARPGGTRSRRCWGTAVIFYNGVVLRARALVRAVLVIHRAGSLAVRVGRRWTIFCENLVEATKEARNRFVAHRLRLSPRLRGLRR